MNQNKDSKFKSDQSDSELVISQSWSGPIPPPAVFNSYSTETQEWLLHKVDKEIEHRHNLDLSEVVDRRWVILAGFLGLIAFLATICVVAYFLKDALSYFVGGIGVGAVGLYIGNRSFKALVLLDERTDRPDSGNK